MLEALIGFGVLGGLLGLAWLATLPWEPLFLWGTRLVVAGHLFGVPTGVVFHALLYRALRATGGVPKGWIWRPIPLAQALPRARRLVVMGWAFAGGVGFVAIVLGLVLMCTAMASAYLNGV